MQPSLTIRALSEAPEWLDHVAQWHHQEWIKGRAQAKSAEAKPLENNGPTDALSERDSLQKRAQLLLAHCDQGNFPVTFVAFHDGQPVGSASIVYYQFTKSHERSQWLTNVYVLPELRSRGIGEWLVNHACNYAEDKGLSTLKLYTHDQAEFYLKRGWQAAGGGLVQGRRVAVLVKSLSH